MRLVLVQDFQDPWLQDQGHIHQHQHLLWEDLHHEEEHHHGEDLQLQLLLWVEHRGLLSLGLLLLLLLLLLGDLHEVDLLWVDHRDLLEDLLDQQPFEGQVLLLKEGERLRQQAQTDQLPTPRRWEGRRKAKSRRGLGRQRGERGNEGSQGWSWERRKKRKKRERLGLGRFPS